MDFVRVGTRVAHARREGDPSAPVIVLVNPLGADLRLWGRLVPYLSDHFHVVRYDQRGHGLSQLGPGPCTIEDLALDLAGLLDQLDTGPSFLCGIGLGALTALALAAHRPELASGLALGDVGPTLLTAAAWQEHIAEVRAGGLEAVAPAVLAGWFTEAFLTQRPEEIEGWRAMLLRTPGDGYLHACAALRDAHMEACARDVRVPTLLLQGHVAGAGTQLDRLARLIPNTTATRLGSCGPLAAVTRPGTLAAALTGFVEATGAR